MTCPSTSSPRNSSYSSVCHLKLIASNPLTTSILGTLLFIDKRGIFRPILNAFDPISCRKAGIKPLRLTHDLKDYIKTTPSNEVLVQISPGGTVQNCAYDDFVHILSTNPGCDKLISAARESKQGVFVHPHSNTASTAVIAGPEITTRQLQLEESILVSWVQMNTFKIGAAARKAMEIYPPKDQSRTICLCLTEILAASWHTYFIKTDSNPNSVAIGFKAGQKEGEGIWEVIESPDSTSSIIGGLGNALGKVQWTVGSNGIPVSLSSRLTQFLYRGCCNLSEPDDFEPISPLQYPCKEN